MNTGNRRNISVYYINCLLVIYITCYTETGDVAIVILYGKIKLVIWTRLATVLFINNYVN